MLLFKSSFMNFQIIMNLMGKRNTLNRFGSTLYSGLLFFICLNFSWNITVSAQQYVPVKDVAEFKSFYATKSVEIKTLKSDFIQEKSISMIKNKLISNGSFIFKRNNNLRMEYFKPYAYLFVMKNDQILIKNNQKKSAVSVSSSRLFKMISQLTIDCLTGNILTSNDFDIKISENAAFYHLDLFPNQKMIKSLFTEIDILISKSNFTVEKLELRETSGDNTTLTFSNKQLNIPVSDEVFSIN